MQPNNPPQQPTPMGQAMQQQSQPQQSTPSIDPELSKSIIDNLKSQSQQIEQAQSQISDSNDLQSQQANQALKQKQSTISRALGQLNDSSMQGKIGQAMGDGSSKWANMCEAFAEQQIYGHTGIYPTAYAAYQDNATKGNIKTSTNNIPTNAQVFMAPDTSNGGNGHTGVMQSNGKFLAPLSNGSIEEFSIPEWQKYSGQRFIGWSPPPKK